MKIYINNLNLDVLNDIAETLKDHMINSETYIKLYTNEGIYRIEDKKIYSLETCDKEIKILKNYYENFTLIIDYSFFHKYICSSIHGKTHLSFQTKKYYYKINPFSELQLVIKYISNNGKFIPNDIYFDLQKDIDINDLFIKKEINEFLSVLN
jgi:hypothetical protein